MTYIGTRGSDLTVVRRAVLAALVLWTSAARAEPTPEAGAQAPAVAGECLQAHKDAQLLRKDGLLIEARERLLRCAQRDCPPVVINDCAGWLPALDNSIPTAVFAISDSEGRDVAEAKVVDQRGQLVADRCDGRAVALNPGVYALKITATGYEPAHERIILRESEKNRIVRIELVPLAAESAGLAEPRPRPGKPIPTASWILGATGLASAVVAGVSGVLYLGARSDIRQPCADGDASCEREHRAIAARGKTYVAIDWVAGSLAGASLIAALVVYAVSEPAREPQVQTTAGGGLQWQLGLAPAGPAVRVQGSF